MPGRHTSKQKRQASHVADSERRRGMDPKRAESVGWATVNARKNLPAGDAYAAMGKAFQVVSIDEAYASVVKARGTEPAAGKPKKFPRDMSPSVRMKPVSDEDAMRDKVRGRSAARKALATGYGRTSGGGALKAPNRDHLLDLSLTVDDLSRAMEAMTRPTTSSGKSPKAVDGGGATELSNSLRDMRPSKTNVAYDGTRVPRTRDLGRIKTTGKPTIRAVGSSKDRGYISRITAKGLSMTNFNDLFKSELGTPADDVLCACPHCEVPITKGDLEKAAHGGKGKVTHLSGPKHGKSGAHVRDQNPDGGTMRGGSGHGVHSPSRGVPGAKKTDENHVQTTSSHRGPLPGVSKADDCSDDHSEHDGSDDNDSEDQPDESRKGIHYPDVGRDSRPFATSHTNLSPAAQKKNFATYAHTRMPESKRVVPNFKPHKATGPAKQVSSPRAPEVAKKSVTIRGTEFVQWVDDGSDAELAKSIAEGTLGGTSPTRPLDLNNDLTRLLV